MKKSSDKVCAEFCARFPSYRNHKNEDRIEFMLEHPIISSQLDKWIEEGNSNGPNSAEKAKRKKTNVNNHLIENDDGDNTKPLSVNNLVGCKYAKNPEQSAKLRSTGNTLFMAKQLHESLEAYNAAIRFAPNPELLCLSLANRSAVYFDLGKEEDYQLAIKDIDLALKYGYPEKLKSKLLLRKTNIYVKLKQWQNAKAVIEELNNHGLQDETHLHQDMKLKVNELTLQIDEHTNSIVESKEPLLSLANLENQNNILFYENDKFENANSSVMVKYSDQSTRFVVAASSLQKKDVIFREDPYASVLLPQFYETHCHNCHRSLKNQYFIPCNQCTQVKFCSEPCSISAWNTYHKYECHSLDLLHSVGIAHLGVRVVLTAGAQTIIDCLEKHEEVTQLQNLKIFEKGSFNYHRVFSLIDHIKDMHQEDVFQYTLTASLLTNWLIKKTSFLLDTKKDHIYRIGSSLLHHICQLICNAHAITDILSDINLDRVSLSTAEESQLRIATAIFPAASMMNHSCDPNIAFKFQNGKTLLVKAVKNIPEGEQVFNCYGPHFRRMSVKSRQEVLNDQYFFKCSCERCQEETSSGLSFVERFTSFKCEKCEGPVTSPDPEGEKSFSCKCQECGYTMDVQDQMAASIYTDRLWQDGQVLLERGNVTQALKIFLTCFKQYPVYLHKNHSSIGHLCDAIGRCYTINGEFSKAIPFVKQSLVYVEKRFGSESIEFGQELKKLVDIIKQCNQNELCDYEDNINDLILKYQSILDF